ncbi:MAG: translation initiation factor [Candidatus Aenigmatarchaeota archaeon]
MTVLCKCGNPLSGSNCSVCGLPPELCVCTVISRAEQKIKIFVEKRKFGKPTTIIEGITERGKEIAKQLKMKLACGGTYKENRIELQGDHKNKVKDLLIKIGFSENQIEII